MIYLGMQGQSGRFELITQLFFHVKEALCHRRNGKQMMLLCQTGRSWRKLVVLSQPFVWHLWEKTLRKHATFDCNYFVYITFWAYDRKQGYLFIQTKEWSSQRTIAHHSTNPNTRWPELPQENPIVCVLFSPCPFLLMGFWDGVFSESHIGGMQRAFFASWVRVVIGPFLTSAAISSCCTGQDQIAEGLLLGMGPPWYKRGPIKFF